MNKSLLLPALLLALLPAGARAYEGEVRLWEEGAESWSSTALLTAETRITFNGGVTVTNGKETKTFPWTKAARITFHTSESGVETAVPDAAAIRLRENPVADRIAVEGYAGAPCALSVFSLTGTRHIYIPQWNGADVDASFLPSGVYVLSLDNLNLKFIKK